MKNKKIIQWSLMIVSLGLIAAGFLLLIRNSNDDSVKVIFKNTSNQILYEKELDAGGYLNNFVPEVEVGYYFVGWFLGEELYDFTKPITKDIELIARFEPLAGNDEGSIQNPDVIPGDEVIKETDIQFNISKTVMTVGETAKIEANLVPEDATVPDIRIYCENIVICSVDESGVVTAQRSGTTNIILESFHGVSKKVEITVNPSYEAQISGKCLRIISSDWKYVEGRVTLKYKDEEKTYTLTVPKIGINLERELDQVISVEVD